MDLRAAREAVSVCYQNASPSARHYVQGKLRWDPVTLELLSFAEKEGPLGLVVDAGCGRGQFSLLLATSGFASSVIGFDSDAEKVELARSASELAPKCHCAFQQGDLLSYAYPPCNTILLLDVLHYLPAAAQLQAMDRAARALLPGGRILLRETAPSGFSASCAKFAERVGKWLGVNRGLTLDFIAATDLAKSLGSAGLVFRCEPERGALHNMLVVGERRH